MQVNRAQFFQIGQLGYFNTQNSRRQNGYVWHADSRDENMGNSAQDARARRRMLSESRQEEQSRLSGTADSDGKKVFQSGLQSNIVSDSMGCASAIRAARTKSKNTSLKLKKLRYNFKSISTQILRSKTSNIAKQVAGKARREVVRLKRLSQKEYDAEELRYAILHAQAMERVAKKKARHLLEEELAKAGGPCLGELEEKELSEEEREKLENAYGAQETGLHSEEYQSESGGELTPGPTFAELQGSLEQSSVQSSESMAQMEAMLEKLETASLSESLGGEMMESMSGMMDEMWESMRDLLEEMGLEDLAEGLTGAAGRDMDPADLKMMKLKHRLKELKEIAEADSKYLKALFDKLAKESAAASSPGNSMGGGSAPAPAPAGGGIPAGAAAGGSPAAALPEGGSFAAEAAGAAAAVPADISGGIDISV